MGIFDYLAPKKAWSPMDTGQDDLLSMSRYGSSGNLPGFSETQGRNYLGGAFSGSPDMGNPGGFDMGSWGKGLGSISGFGGSPLGAVGSLADSNRGMGSSFFRQKYGDGSTGGGWGEAGLGIASGLFNSALAYGAYKDSKEQTRFAKDNANRNMRNSEAAFNMKVDANAKDLADRAAPGNTIAEDYSKKYRIA